MKQIANVEIVRLKAMADMLDDVVEKDFDLNAWVSRVPEERRTVLFGLIEQNPGCGFAGCAMGWAAHNRIFPNFLAMQSGHLIYKTANNNVYDWQAVEMLLGINRHVAEYFFHKSYYKVHATTTMVANRIRRFVAKIEAIRARDRLATVKPKLVLVA